ncbi:MAG: RnfABCDGE type electron transport complex subunit D [Ruminococcaceae bacterium]|nr:RnfABCDGE type electron transport complex subunit D [Oscillospiraceae bacterium]
MTLTTPSSPHIKSPVSTARLMRDVLLALLPALAVGIWRLGLRGLFVTLLCVAVAVATEWVGDLLLKKRTVRDGSAAVTGLLLAMTLPPTVPYWLAAVGSLFAVGFVKLLGGGLGENVFNPALAARAFMLLICPVGMTVYTGVDAATGATPLHHMVMPALPEESVWDMFLGNCSGSIGEISALALLLGALYLVLRRVITLRIPLAYLGTVALLTLVFHKTDAPLMWMLYSLTSGGVMLGALFMATDYTTSPVTPKGQWIYGIGCGALTVFFRYYGLYPEGVTYAILSMNALAWLLDRYTAPRRFGKAKGGVAR